MTVKATILSVASTDLLSFGTGRNTLSYGTMSSATKAQSQKIFEKLKTKPANKVKHREAHGFMISMC